MAGNAARRRELPEEQAHAVLVLADLRVHFAVRAFQIRTGVERRAAVSGSGDVDDLRRVRLDQPVQMDVDEVLARRGAPVAEEPRFDLRCEERCAQQRVFEKIDLADAQIVGGVPVSDHLVEQVGRKRPLGNQLDRLPFALRRDGSRQGRIEKECRVSGGDDAVLDPVRGIADRHACPSPKLGRRG